MAIYEDSNIVIRNSILLVIHFRLLNLAMFLLDFSPRIPLGTFSILLMQETIISFTTRPILIATKKRRDLTQP